jgi:hypothetical protein
MCFSEEYTTLSARVSKCTCAHTTLAAAAACRHGECHPVRFQRSLQAEHQSVCRARVAPTRTRCTATPAYPNKRFCCDWATPPERRAELMQQRAVAALTAPMRMQYVNAPCLAYHHSLCVGVTRAVTAPLHPKRRAELVQHAAAAAAAAQLYTQHALYAQTWLAPLILLHSRHPPPVRQRCSHALPPRASLAP